jgi:hypothetical protein
MDVIGPLSTAPFSRSMLHARGSADSGFQDSEFRIPYGVWAGAGDLGARAEG